jgi:radical SAM protein with 4Fe4S-binding SPASM domain
MSESWPLKLCVWELTLACNARCTHCGSDAGKPRPDELDTAEALVVIAELARLGAESVTFSGGEPLLRSDWPQLARAVRAAGMSLDMITNGLLAAKQADVIAGCGFSAVTFSIDGPAPVHDFLRGLDGGLGRTLEGARALRKRGVRIGAATQINRHNLARLYDTLDLLTAEGFSGWQLQLTMPHGRARGLSQGDLCLRPDELPRLETLLVALQGKAPFFINTADNIGYMGRHEPRLRSGRALWERCWMGCGAGIEVVGIASDGTVRGCLSLPAGAADEGNVRCRSLAGLWNDESAFAYNRTPGTDDLGPGCRDCAFGTLCRGGCQSLCLATTGVFHHNAHCIFAVTQSEGGRP